MRELDARFHDVAARFVDCPRRTIHQPQVRLVDLEGESRRAELHAWIGELWAVDELILVMKPVHELEAQFIHQPRRRQVLMPEQSRVDEVLLSDSSLTSDLDAEVGLAGHVA